MQSYLRITFHSLHRIAVLKISVTNKPHVYGKLYLPIHPAAGFNTSHRDLLLLDYASLLNDQLKRISGIYLGKQVVW